MRIFTIKFIGVLHHNPSSLHGTLGEFEDCFAHKRKDQHVLKTTQAIHLLFGCWHLPVMTTLAQPRLSSWLLPVVGSAPVLASVASKQKIARRTQPIQTHAGLGNLHSSSRLSLRDHLVDSDPSPANTM